MTDNVPSLKFKKKTASWRDISLQSFQASILAGCYATALVHSYCSQKQVNQRNRRGPLARAIGHCPRHGRDRLKKNKEVAGLIVFCSEPQKGPKTPIRIFYKMRPSATPFHPQNWLVRKHRDLCTLYKFTFFTLLVKVFPTNISASAYARARIWSFALDPLLQYKTKGWILSHPDRNPDSPENHAL